LLDYDATRQMKPCRCGNRHERKSAFAPDPAAWQRELGDVIRSKKRKRP